jgi:hypothetical protein
MSLDFLEMAMQVEVVHDLDGLVHYTEEGSEYSFITIADTVAVFACERQRTDRVPFWMVQIRTDTPPRTRAGPRPPLSRDLGLVRIVHPRTHAPIYQRRRPDFEIGCTTSAWPARRGTLPAIMRRRNRRDGPEKYPVLDEYTIVTNTHLEGPFRNR